MQPTGLASELFPSSGSYFFCGPRAICTITGLHADTVHEQVAAIRAVTPKRGESSDPTRIRVMDTGELRKVLGAFGYTTSLSATPNQLRIIINRDQFGNRYTQTRDMHPTLSKWVQDRQFRRGVHIVRIKVSRSGKNSGHFIVVNNGRLFDHNGQGVTPVGHKYARHKVTHFITITHPALS